LLTLRIRNFKEEENPMKKLLVTSIITFCAIAVFAQTKISGARTPEEKLNEAYTSGLFRSSEGTILDVASSGTATSYFNILNWLEGRVAGLRVVTTRGGVRVPIIRGQQASIYVNETHVSASYLNSLPSSEVAMIKVFKTPFLGNPTGSSGAVAIYTFQVEAEEEDEGK
jgi:hypothetical protein